MAFNFVISQLDSIPSLDGMDKVISTIHWRAQKQDEDFTADTYGWVGILYASIATVIVALLETKL